MEPLEHISKLLNHSHHARTQQAERSRNILSTLLLEDLRKLIKGQLITSQRNRPALIIPRIQKDFRRDRTNISAPNHLQRLPFERHPEARSKNLAHEVWCEIIVESRRAQDCPIHLALFGLFNEMFLDVMLVDEVGDIGGIVD